MVLQVLLLLDSIQLDLLLPVTAMEAVVTTVTIRGKLLDLVKGARMIDWLKFGMASSELALVVLCS